MQAARTIGGPGAGKTERALEIMLKCLGSVCADPLRIGFVSFTRAARWEAATRAGKQFGLRPSHLQKDGWFRTLHSCAYRLLGVGQGELLTGSAEDNDWLRNALQDPQARFASHDIDDDLITVPAGESDVGKILSLWEVARNLQKPVLGPWQRARASDERLSDLGTVWKVIGRYEAAKRADGRLDFGDLLMRYAGRQFTGDHKVPFAPCLPAGDVPSIPVWIFDEAQDCSPLAALVFRRLSAQAQYVYLFGDDWQSIFEWAGADRTILTIWPVQREEILPTCYRCSSKILAFGDAIMLRGGYQQRPFRSEREGGIIEDLYLDDALDTIRPGEDVLVLARTNEYARTAAQALDGLLVPWAPLKGGSTHAAPARAAGVRALLALQAGEAVGAEGLWRLTSLLPSTAGNTRLLERGIKTRLGDADSRRLIDDRWPDGLDLQSLDFLTEHGRNVIASGEYVELLEPPAARMVLVGRKHGPEALENPKCRVGTHHGAKGMSAEHVVLVNRIPKPTAAACETEEGLDEERRVWFTAATRAREKLTVAGMGGQEFEELG